MNYTKSVKKLSKPLLIKALNRLGDLLAEKNTNLTLTVCGGIVHLLHFKSRQVTHDIDAVFPVAYYKKEALVEAIKKVGEEFNLETNPRSLWFNDDISCFGLKTQSDVTIFRHPFLHLKSAKFEELLCLKLYAYRDQQDKNDATELLKKIIGKDKTVLYKEIQQYRPRRGEFVSDQEFKRRYDATWVNAFSNY